MKTLPRRGFLKQAAQSGTGLVLAAGGLSAPSPLPGAEQNGIAASDKNLFWGDIHNHNAVGYAKGTLERSYDIACSHLDFYCFTAHSQWHDIPKMPQDKQLKFLRGFEVTRKNWDKIKRLAEENYAPGKFVSFIGYEFHSSAHGDVCIIFPGSEAELVYTKGIKEFQQFARDRGAILIPHHPAYKQGWRGQNWNVLDTSVSPVVEIFSEHGCAESDRSPFPYIRHSMGGRNTYNTLQALWEKGYQVGVVASTDDHLGYPGAYGEGLVAAYADSLTRESIMEALKARRTYGVSGDRIELDFRCNGHWMGEVTQPTKNRTIQVKVIGRDAIERVEVLCNNQVIHRDIPVDRTAALPDWSKPVLCRIEFGWGPWGDFEMARICDWKLKIAVDRGKLDTVHPCFQSGPFDEDRRNRITSQDDTSCELTAYTSRKQAYEERATNSVVLGIVGSPKTSLNVSLTQPAQQVVSRSLEQLQESSDTFRVGDSFMSESLLLHRTVFPEHYQTAFEFTDNRESKTTDWYYVRVVQTNGSMAWSSPIWVKSA